MTAFSINTTTGEYLINGHPVPTASAVTVDMRAGEKPQIAVELYGPGTIEGDGIATVVREPTPTELRETLANWLESLDPAHIHTAAQARYTNMRQTQTDLILQVLTEMARGD